MQLGSVLGIASGAMRVESDRLAGSAQRVAKESTQDSDADRVSLGADRPAAVSGYTSRGAAVSGTYTPQGGHDDDVDLASEQFAQMSSRRAFQANASVLRTVDQMLGTLVTQKG